MVTVRQIERFWNTKSYKRLAQDLMATRPEGAFALEGLERPFIVASLAMVRLEELNQGHLPFYTKLLRAVLAAQDADGGWGDPAATALCVRALLCGRGDGPAIERGMGYLANLQKSEGIWPAGPLRRMPEDPVASLFMLYELGDNARFREVVRFDDAVGWFESNLALLGRECRGLWEWASLRCRTYVVPGRRAQTSLFAA
ncbi:MAG: Squalene-hopene cyclase C-terminal domain [Phycisphaerales bacterium]|nr:Squalene-hopene cyclase C-terminal domain [Phycisphaerales bacterium]